MMQSINETLPLWVQRHCVQTQWISGNFGREWSRSHAFASFLRKTPKSPPSRCKRIVVQVSYYSCIYARLYTVYDIIYVYEKNTWFHAVVFLWCSLLKKMLSKYKIFLEKQLPPPNSGKQLCPVNTSWCPPSRCCTTSNDHSQRQRGAGQNNDQREENCSDLVGWPDQKLAGAFYGRERWKFTFAYFFNNMQPYHFQFICFFWSYWIVKTECLPGLASHSVKGDQ